ncbi:hypothetical protein K435DRAFT_763817 [Dendrothele bispora CBS 962.96]|uniref:Uncharacterized protein n=1 Tax=Dendrothele bispora (strain CBS 962.96) TaxID=1314807 RepID=A0A4S8LAN8_DENBC|nr:hypothetical protein K435DRAFT_763817 [Dendrothele bispora CBS 962.96]
MPAPEVNALTQDARPIVGHVNLMVDTFIANASPEDLRSAIRGLLSSGMPGVASAFTSAARERLGHVDVKSIPGSRPLFENQDTSRGEPLPTEWLFETLARTRTLYGVGMGFASLEILTAVVRSTVGFQWSQHGEMATTLTAVDADIGQAIQSCKEEMDAGKVSNIDDARLIVQNLRSAVKESMSDVESWGGEFPFERASFSVEFWKL